VLERPTGASSSKREVIAILRPPSRGREPWRPRWGLPGPILVPMRANSRAAFCGECGHALGDPPSQPAPCPICGSMRKDVRVGASGSVTPRGRLKTKQKRPGFRGSSGRRRAVSEGVFGDERSADGSWVHKEWYINREQDLYRELVVAEDGTVLRDVEEPLSEHRGHGSDRPRDSE